MPRFVISFRCWAAPSGLRFTTWSPVWWRRRKTTPSTATTRSCLRPSTSTSPPTKRSNCSSLVMARSVTRSTTYCPISLNVPGKSFHYLQFIYRQQRTRHVVSSLTSNFCPSAKSSVNSVVTVTELLPALCDIIQPSFRPVRCGDFSDLQGHAFWVTVDHFMYDPESFCNR